MSPVKIKLGGYQPPTSVHNRAAEVFGEELAKRVGDVVSYKMDGNMCETKGIQAIDLPNLVEAGELTMCYFASSYMAERVPEVAIFDLPFVVQSRDKAYAALDGELGDLLKEKFLAEMGVRILGFWDNGFRHFTNGVKEIRTPADCAGLKMRSMNSEVHQEFFKLLGMEPTFVDVADLVEKVKSGEIDAQENPLTNTYRFGTYQYHRHITLTGHFFGMVLVMVNNEMYQSWPAEIQDAVQASVDVATVAQRGFAQAEDDEVMNALDPAENDIVRLSDDERRAFEDAVTPLVAKHRARLGDRLFELVE
ncbi:MAG: TRAP transporter substrate-binding protein [Rhodospirillales bacterium]|jgi:TRAP-type C4-dicarboxylate transport system substrate-binding protein